MKKSVEKKKIGKPIRRGRGPSPSKTAETKRVVLEAALALFARNGFSNTRMSDVASQAGLAKGTLYLYFETKEALFEGVLYEAIREPLANASTILLNFEESFKSLLLRVVVPILRDFETSRRADIVRLVIAEGARFPEIADAYRRIIIEPMKAILVKHAKLAFQKGELRSDVFERFPILFISPGVIATVWNGLFGKIEPMDSAKLFQEFIELVFAKEFP